MPCEYQKHKISDKNSVSEYYNIETKLLSEGKIIN